jgi:prepilin-type N-terminal cleavage/methylation domain-containing protein
MKKGFRLAYQAVTRFAFTLAEVLITLGIIGIIAALTMPTLIANYKEKEAVARLKKAYSVLSSAFSLAQQELDTTPDNWDLIAGNSPQGAENLLNALAPYLNIVKNCATSEPGCFAIGYKRLNGTNYSPDMSRTDMAKIVLSDGTALAFGINSPDCTAERGDSEILSNVCAWVLIDINGNKNPNQYGTDMFSFHLLLVKMA